MLRLRAMLIASFLLPCAARAQLPLVYFLDVGHARTDSIAGVGASLGGGLEYGKLRALVAIDMIVASRNSGRYYESRDNLGGQNRCIDKSTSDPVADGKCNAIQGAGGLLGSVELTLSQRIPIIVGAGYRAAQNGEAVYTIGYAGHVRRWGAHWRASVLLGGDYRAYRLGVALPQIPQR